MSQIDNVSVVKKANVYFDGKCISHTVLCNDGSKLTVGVVLPSTLTFGTDAPERMEIVSGRCRVRLDGQADWQSYAAGSEFRVSGKSKFDIEVTETLDYVCHFE